MRVLQMFSKWFDYSELLWTTAQIRNAVSSGMGLTSRLCSEWFDFQTSSNYTKHKEQFCCTCVWCVSSLPNFFTLHTNLGKLFCRSVYHVIEVVWLDLLHNSSVNVTDVFKVVQLFWTSLNYSTTWINFFVGVFHDGHDICDATHW